MTSVEEAVKPDDTFGEVIDLDDCNPLLLEQLARQAAEARRPRVLQGCEVQLGSGGTVTISAGIIFAPSRFIAASEPWTFNIVWPGGSQYRIDTISLTDGGDTALIHMVTGTPAPYPLMPALSTWSQGMAWVIVHGYKPVTIHSSVTEVAAEQRRILEETKKRDREKRARQDACRHVGAHRVETTTWSAMARTYRVTCPHCAYSWTERAGAGCCDDTICHCRH